MKKHLIALAILGTVAGAASAQSSVTLYGLVSLGVVQSTGVGKKLDAGNGYSYLGFKGQEDLGGGLKAFFDLQQRFSPESGGNDGSANGRPLFQGQTIVGLSGGFGAVQLGRSKTPYQAMEDSGTPFSSLYQGSQDLLASGYSTDARQPNGAGDARTDHVAYSSPNFSGFSAKFGYGFKNSSADGNTTADPQHIKNLTSWSVGYAAGPAKVTFGMEQNRVADKAMALAGSYDFSVAKLWAAYGTNDTKAIAGAKRKATTVAVSAPFGAATAMLGYATIKAEGTAVKSNKLSLGGTYALSKRTSLYSTYAETKVKTNPSSKTKGIDLGVSHAF